MTSPARIRASIALQAPERRRYRDPGELGAMDACPHCRQRLARHEFTTPDGLKLATWHCKEHGDVLPVRTAMTSNAELLDAVGERR